MSKARDLADLGAVTDRLDTVGASDGALSNRNILINGDFQISQRGDYSSATAHSGNKTYYLDRWAAGNSGCSTTLQDTGRKAKMVCTSGGSGTMRLYQLVELQDINKYLGQQITLSAKVTSNSSDCRLLSYMDGWQVEAARHSGSGQEEILSVTFTVPSTILTTEASFFVGIDGIQSANVTINTGDYFEAAEVQLEIGDTATPFEHRSYSDQLQSCQRYYYRPGDGGNTEQWLMHGLSNTGGLQLSIQHPVRMRATPSVGHDTNNPYWEANPWTAVGAAMTISSINTGHMGPDGGDMAIFQNNSVTRGTTYNIGTNGFSFDAEL